jgi:tRNA 5-methylaminomethyl-2-thiouridine biosynthesis bifunctional protein
MQYTNLIWRDGQPYSKLFDDIYYSPALSAEDTEGTKESISGSGEFEHVFFKHNGLPERWQDKQRFVIGELGFGSGLNCLLTMRHWLQDHCRGDERLHYIAIERYPLSPASITRLFVNDDTLRLYVDELLRHYPPPIKGTHLRYLFDGKVCIHFHFMDVCEALRNTSMNVDAWYLDGFAPAKNPAMWSEEVFQHLARNSREGSRCSTYTAAGLVKRGLQQAGFEVEKVKGHGKKREMITARYHAHDDEAEASAYRYCEKPWFIQPGQTEVTDETRHASRNSTRHANIIGAGVAGLSVAYSLVRRGWTVDVIDRHGDVAKESSANPCAIVYPRLSVNNDTDFDFYLAAFYYSVYQLGQLQAQSILHGGESFWYESGMLQMIDRKRIEEIMSKYQFNCDYLSIADIERYKKLRCSEDDTVFVEHKSAGVVLPVPLCKALQQACGDSLNIIRAEVGQIKRDDECWSCRSVDGQVFESETLVIASGVCIDDLGLELELPAESIRGQVAALNEVDESADMTRAVNAGKYFTPLINGLHYIGATYNRGVSNTAIDDEDNMDLLKILNGFYPDVFDNEDVVSSWAGFRLMTKDRVPVVGAVPDSAFFKQEYEDIRHGNNQKGYAAARYMNGLYVSLAHGSRGFTSSLLSAEIIASQIEAEPVPVNDEVMAYLSPSRFIVNNLKRG